MKHLALLFGFCLYVAASSAQSGVTLFLDSVSNTTVCNGQIDVYFHVRAGAYYPSSLFKASISSWSNSVPLNGGVTLSGNDTVGVIHVTNLPEGKGMIYVHEVNFFGGGPNGPVTSSSNQIYIESGIYTHTAPYVFDANGDTITNGICSGAQVNVYPWYVNPYFTVSNTLGMPYDPLGKYYPTDTFSFYIGGQVTGVNCPLVQDTIHVNVFPAATLTLTPNDTSFCGDSLLVTLSVTGGSGSQWIRWTSNSMLLAQGNNLYQTTLYRNPPFFLHHLEVLATDNAAPSLCSAYAESTHRITYPMGGQLSFVKNPVCEGKQAQLKINPLGGSGNYVIMCVPQLPQAVHAGTNVFVATQTTTYTIMISDDYVTCPAYVDTITLHVLPPPPLPTISVNGNQLTCNLPGYTYKWFRNGIALPNSNTQVYTMTQNGLYTVQITDSLGCTATSDAVTDIAEGLVPYFSVHPNPCQDQLWIQFGGQISGGIEVRLMDLQGRLHLYVSENARQDLKLNTSALATGFYLLEISHEGRKHTQKIWKD